MIQFSVHSKIKRRLLRVVDISVHIYPSKSTQSLKQKHQNINFKSSIKSILFDYIWKYRNDLVERIFDVRLKKLSRSCVDGWTFGGFGLLQT